MAMYFSYQLKPRSEWTTALSDDRAAIIRDLRPPFSTVLDTDMAIDEKLTREEMMGVKYRGPFYVDLDAKEEGDNGLEYTIDQFKILLNKLKDYRVDLSTIYIYATGGRGFHIEVPSATFIKKEPATGMAALPYVYKEMALELAVDTMDLRIYSSRRMWRTPNVQRENELYKVQITPDEAYSMTPASYEEICSQARVGFGVAPPVYSSGLAFLYATARDKVELQYKRIKAMRSKGEELKRFDGAWPKSIADFMASGAGLKEGVGFNQISMQLALTARELGKTEDELVQACDGLIRYHESDGERYNTPEKRVRELRNQFRYMDGNPCYEFSTAGLLSLFNYQYDVGDLRPRTSTSSISAEEVAAADNVEDEQGQPLAPTVEPENNFVGHIKVNKGGIFIADQDGKFKQACLVGLVNPDTLLDARNNDMLGYEFDVWVPAKDGGRQLFPQRRFFNMSTFANRSSFHAAISFTSQSAGTMSDQNASMMTDYFSHIARQRGGQVYRVGREGLDFISVPGEGKDGGDIVWASPYEVIINHGKKDPEKGRRYRFHGITTQGGTFASDLWKMKPMEDTPLMREFLDKLFELNQPVVMAQLLGWFSAAFLCQLLRKIKNEFPMLQVFGESGAGKSKTIELFAQMAYGEDNKPMKLATGTLTPHVIFEKLQQSASIPAIFDEVKAREMKREKLYILKDVFKNAYDASESQRGALSREKGTSEVVVKRYELGGPVVFMGESIEDETAVLERCVVVRLSKESRAGRSEVHEWLEKHGTLMGHIGRSILDFLLDEERFQFEMLKPEYYEVRDRVKAKLTPEQAENLSRPVTNIAIVVLGLQMLDRRLEEVFGDTYKARIAALIECIEGHIIEIIPSPKSEMVKVLEDMAHLTRSAIPEFRLHRGRDYCVEGDYLYINVKDCFEKYQRYRRSLGHDPLYDSTDKFYVALKLYKGLASTMCKGCEIYSDPWTLMAKIDIEKSAALGAPPFDS